jgi:hypothetical protein
VSTGLPQHPVGVSVGGSGGLALDRALGSVPSLDGGRQLSAIQPISSGGLGSGAATMNREVAGHDNMPVHEESGASRGRSISSSEGTFSDADGSIGPGSTRSEDWLG